MRSLDEALGARALIGEAEFADFAVVVDVASGLAKFVDADLTLEAVLVGVAEFETDTSGALFSTGTVGVKGTSWHAVTSMTDRTSRTNVGCSTNFGYSDTAFSGSWHTRKSWRTLAGFSLVLGSA